MSYEEFTYASMSCGYLPPLSSIAAVRPVFLIVMGVFLMVIAWRLSKGTEGWTARLLILGALLLGLGYSVMMPLHESGIIKQLTKGGSGHSGAMAWKALMMVTMNGGWLLFGVALAMHARLFTLPSPRRNPALPPAATHEFTT